MSRKLSVAWQYSGYAMSPRHSRDERPAHPEDVLFFPSIVTLKLNVRWMLVATSGPNWGCFLMDVQ